MPPTPPHQAPTHFGQMWFCICISAGNCHSTWILCWIVCLLILPSEILKLPHWPHLGETFLFCGNFSSFTTLSPGWVSIPKSFVSLFAFIFCPPHFNEIFCLSRYLGSSANVWKLFCGSFSTWRWTFDVFMGEKVISPSYSFAILGLLPHPNKFFDSGL